MEDSRPPAGLAYREGGALMPYADGNVLSAAGGLVDREGADTDGNVLSAANGLAYREVGGH
jgi:hypothetical protein